jgi:hypothetical protein
LVLTANGFDRACRFSINFQLTHLLCTCALFCKWTLRDVARPTLSFGAQATENCPRSKSFAFHARSFALPLKMQNPLDSIGHGRSGSCTTPHSTADLRTHCNFSVSNLKNFALYAGSNAKDFAFATHVPTPVCHGLRLPLILDCPNSHALATL